MYFFLIIIISLLTSDTVRGLRAFSVPIAAAASNYYFVAGVAPDGLLTHRVLVVHPVSQHSAAATNSDPLRKKRPLLDRVPDFCRESGSFSLIWPSSADCALFLLYGRVSYSIIRGCEQGKEKKREKGKGKRKSDD